MSNRETEIFNQVVHKRVHAIQNTLVEKSKEYATDVNPFHNFHVTARLNKCTPQQALWGFASKHLVSIIDMVHNARPATPQLVNEKFGDMITYLVILEAMYALEMSGK